jgi:hypothetical protein
MAWRRGDGMMPPFITPRKHPPFSSVKKKERAFFLFPSQASTALAYVTICIRSSSKREEEKSFLHRSRIYMDLGQRLF